MGPFASGATSIPSVVTGLGISLTNGTTFPRNSIIRRTPMSRNALTQNTGNILRVIRPFRIPSRISSSVKTPWSKNFSMSPSSFSAAASISFWCRSAAFSFSSAGISRTSGVPPSGFHLYIFIFRTSIIALNDAPHEIGYCICTILFPKDSRSCSMVLS